MRQNGRMAYLSSLFARPRSLRTVWATSALVLALPVSPAAAHGDLQGTFPEKGSKLNRPPVHLIINFTEPPSKQSVVSVEDGCSDEVVDEVEFQGNAGHVYLSGGEAGKWKVSYEVVSAVDGHKTDGSYSLTVTGKPDCSPDKGGDGGDKEKTGPGPQVGADDDPGGSLGDESSFPVVPVALGSAGLVALALVARRLAG